MCQLKICIIVCCQLSGILIRGAFKIQKMVNMYVCRVKTRILGLTTDTLILRIWWLDPLDVAPPLINLCDVLQHTVKNISGITTWGYPELIHWLEFLIELSHRKSENDESSVRHLSHTHSKILDHLLTLCGITIKWW